MKSSTFLLSAILVISSSPALLAENWPAWRGDVLGSGETKETDLPRSWSKDSNVRWRTPLPDRGNSTPIIHGDKVFVTQCIEEDHWRGLICFDRKDGSLLWKNGLTYDKPERTHDTNPYCSASPATDGTRVVAAYGSAGIACYDFDGKELWKRDFGPVDHVWGTATSPVLHGDLCFYYHGPGKGALLVALDKNSGEIVWKYTEPQWVTEGRTDGFKDDPKDGVVGSFSTPIIANTGSRDELIMSFPNEIKAFDPTSGSELWSCGGLNPLVYTSPVFSNGNVVAMGGYFGNSVAVKTGGRGDVTPENRLWHETRHHGGIGSGVAKDGYLYYHNSSGIAHCIEIATGKPMWEERLPGKGKSWTSFLLSGDLIYTLSQPGDTVIFKANPEKFEPVAQCDIGETCNASLAPSDGEFFIRSHDALWCISE